MVYICMSFFVSFMGYYIPTIARANVHFTIPLLVLLPYYVHELKKKKLPYKGTYMIIIIYLLCRLHIYFSEYLYVDEIMPYKTFFN